VFIPACIEVRAELEFAGEAKVPAPDITLQTPLPVEGTTAVIVVDAEQITWSAPATATDGGVFLLITTVSLEPGQTPLLTVHTKTLFPVEREFTDEVGEPAVLTFAVPDSTVHMPVPVKGRSAFSVPVSEHTAMSAPALAMLGGRSLVTKTSSKDGLQKPFSIDQRKTFVPGPIPVTVVEGEFASLKLPLPLITVQVPVPTTGVFADMTAVVEQMVWSVPALDVLIGPITVMIMSSKLGVQVPLLIVQRKTLVPISSPVTVEEGLEGSVTVPVPLILVQVPVPIEGAFAASSAVVEHAI
jgi:hypothetical protein